MVSAHIISGYSRGKSHSIARAIVLATGEDSADIAIVTVIVMAVSVIKLCVWLLGNTARA